MTDEERLELLDHARRCDVLDKDNARLLKENAKLRNRLKDLSIAYDASIDAFSAAIRNMAVKPSPKSPKKTKAPKKIAINFDGPDDCQCGCHDDQ